MSQAAIKSTRPSGIPLSQSTGSRKSSRPNTPQTNAIIAENISKTDSRSSTPSVPATIIIDESPIKSQSKHEKRRASNEAPTSQKVRASPKVEVVKETNGKHEKQQETNGTNGNHAAVAAPSSPVIVEEKKEEEATTPKGSKGKKEENAKKEKQQVSDDEMEPLVVDAEPQAPAPASETPKANTKPVRLLTPRQGPPSGRTKPFKSAIPVSERLSNTSTIVNLSTVSEQSPTTSSQGESDSSITAPPSRISGRRSVRPIKEIQLTYRSKDDSSSSLNATVGSNIHNDTINTPYLQKIGARKRTSGNDFDHDGFIDSPSKRARIDFSGFLGYVTTPVTLLKNRLSRVGLTSSTPRKLDTDEEEEVKIADVSGTEASTAEEAKEDGGAEKMEVIEEIVKDVIENEAPQEDNSDIEVKEKQNRSFCVVM